MIADTSLQRTLFSGTNDGQALITKSLCSGHFIADASLYWTSFQVQIHITGLGLTSLFWTRPITGKKFMSILGIVLQFCVSFLRSFIFSKFNGLFWSLKMKIRRDFQPVFTTMVDAFPYWKNIQSDMGQGQKHCRSHGNSSCTWATTTSLQ